VPHQFSALKDPKRTRDPIQGGNLLKMIEALKKKNIAKNGISRDSVDRKDSVGEVADALREKANT
jgi:hypothetical protein